MHACVLHRPPDNYLAQELINCGGWNMGSKWHQGEEQFDLLLFDKRLDLKKTLQNLMMHGNNWAQVIQLL